jgi:glycosyltransferase involved in cell wall biosynthesis
MRVQLIAKAGPGMTGTSRYTMCLFRALLDSGTDARLAFPAPAPIPRTIQRGLKRVGLDAEAFFANYPLRATQDGASVHHVTSQTLATLLLFQRFRGPVVVTVLDIIPYLVRHRPELKPFRHPIDHLFDRLAMIGLRRADALIAISDYTRQTLIRDLGLAAERIRVVHLAVDHQRFRPLVVPDAFRARYGLDEARPYVLYVGSEDPRKNLRALVRAFAIVRRRVGGVKLLKVGAAHFLRERERLQALIAKLGMESDVLFFDDVPDEDLPMFYNAADVFVLPSLYEGFGLPVLEAMACGTPVVCTDATSLPELAGEAAELTGGDSAPLAQAIESLLEDGAQRACLRERGLRRAAEFRWEATARGTVEVYRAILERQPRRGSGEAVAG